MAPAGADTEITGASTAPDTLTSPPEPPTTTPGDEGPMTPTTTATTTTSTTGDTPGTSSGEANTTMADSWCGDGVVDADEACDDGLAGNDDSRFCKADCTLNVCGDGKLFVGWELCDDGAANSDAYGSLCGEQCEPGARCGDHKLQPEFETCDLPSHTMPCSSPLGSSLSSPASPGADAGVSGASRCRGAYGDRGGGDRRRRR